MIGRLRGVVAERQTDGSCILDVGGLGYELFVPLGALDRLPAAPEPVTLYIHTHVREDAIALYGFATQADRDAFRTLLGVSSIGPKLALAIMNVMDAQRLASAVISEDKSAFKGIPGVGRKTVERLMLDLKDRLRAVAATAPAPSGAPAPTAASADTSGPLGTVIGALVQMGYKPAEAERAVEPLRSRADDEPVETLLREALASMA